MIIRKSHGRNFNRGLCSGPWLLSLVKFILFYFIYLFINFLLLLFLRIRPGEEISRNYDPVKTGEKPNTAQTRSKAPELAKFAHAVIFVVKANDPRLKDGKYKDALKKIREHFREDGKNNVCFSSISHSTVRLLIARKGSRLTFISDLFTKVSLTIIFKHVHLYSSFHAQE